MRTSVCFSIVTLSAALILQPVAAQTKLPRVFLLSPERLAEAKAHPNTELLKMVKHDADRALQQKPLSVIDKTETPPSGNKHDYMSMGRYWWPNPDTKNHLPYVRHDGRTNPEILGISDRVNLERMDEAERALALGWYFTGDEQYAQHATLLLRAWFLDPATAMHPNMNFAQYIPGLNTGRGSGVLDSRSLPMAIDAAALLAGSKSWTTADAAGLKQWFTEYDHWLKTSKNADHENHTPNNHGSWFQVQAASIARFLGHNEEARAIGEEVREHRIPSQIDAEGMQKYEMVRTNSFSYSAFNLEALTQLATIVAPLDVDLYKPVKPGAPGLLTALDTLMPYDAEHKWPHQQIKAGLEDSICPALVRAAAHTHEAKYEQAQARFHCKTTEITLIESIGEKQYGEK